MINVEFFEHLGLLAFLIMGLTIFRLATCKPFKCDGEDFDKKALCLGLFKNVLIAFAVSGVYSAGCMWGQDLVMVDINGTKLTIQAALDVMLLAAICSYGVKFTANFAEMIGIKEIAPKVKEVQPGEEKPLG